MALHKASAILRFAALHAARCRGSFTDSLQSVKLISNWYNKEEVATWLGLFNSAQNFGTALVPIVAGALQLHYGWRIAVLFTGFLSLTAGTAVWLFVPSIRTQRVASRQSLVLQHVIKNTLLVIPRSAALCAECTAVEAVHCISINEHGETSSQQLALDVSESARLFAC
jgi:MFS family permease